MRILSVLAVGLLGAALPAQGSTRAVAGNSWDHKFLTRDLTDSWSFDGRPGMWVHAAVKSSQFDPTLQLVRLGVTDADEAVVVEERDDEGSQSRITRRLTEAGRYEIRVSAFERRGGGNYSVRVDRFHSAELTLGTLVKGRFDDDSTAAFWFRAKPGQILSWHCDGPVQSFEFHAFDGRDLTRMPAWHNILTIAKAGEYCVRLQGRKNEGFTARIDANQPVALPLRQVCGFQLQPAALRVYEFRVRAGEFRRILLHREQGVDLRLIHLEKTRHGRSRSGNTAAVRWLPVASKGDWTQWAFVARAKGRFQLQVRSSAEQAFELELRMLADQQVIVPGRSHEDRLSVGGGHFFTFAGRPGQHFEIDLSAAVFDPLLRLTDRDGVQFATDDNGGSSLDSHLDLLIPKAGSYRIQVSSVGDGGGGEYRLQLTEIPIPEIVPGQTMKVSLITGKKSYWCLRGLRGQELLILTRGGLDTYLEILAPDGKLLKRDESSGVGGNGLIAVRLPDDGAYTLRLGALTGGHCELRVLTN